MTKIEEVARAIWSSQYDEDLPREGTVESALAIQLARAAIEAMLEPTENMLKAGFDNDDLGIIWTAAISPEDRREMSRAMITASLQEGKGK